MSNKPYDLEERFVEYGANTALFCNGLPHDMVGQYYGGQLLRSSGSSALNFGEMQGTQSDKDFKYRATVSYRELKESKMNLKILAKINYGKAKARETLLDETEQLIKIMATIIKNKSR